MRYRDGLDAVVMQRLGLLALATASLVTVTLVAQVLQPAAPVQFAAATTSRGSADSRQDFPDTPAGRLQRDIQTALTATRFPALNPAIDDLEDNKAPQWAKNGCGTTGPWNAQHCTYGASSDKKQAAVIGDSIALSWLPGLIPALNTHGYRVHSFVAGSCPAAAVSVGSDSGETAKCDQHRKWALHAIAQLHPQLIILSDASFLVPKLSSGARGTEARREYQSGATATLRALQSIARTVALTAPPGSKSLLDCATVRATPSSCEGTTHEDGFQILLKAQRGATAATGAALINTSSWFCDPYGRCPSFVGTTPVYVDGEHMTRQYSESLEPEIASALRLR